MQANVIVRYLPVYLNAQGNPTAFQIDGGHDMEYIGAINGAENVPIYRRQHAGQQALYAGGQNTADLYYMHQVQQHADLPDVGGVLYCWWPRADGFAAGFYQCARVQ